MLAREKKARVPGSSPVDNFFRHAANQCCGGKFLLLRTRHTLHELHGKRTNASHRSTPFVSLSPSPRIIPRLSSSRTKGKGDYDGHDGCACHVCVYPFGITDDTLGNWRTIKSTGKPVVEQNEWRKKVDGNVEVRLSSLPLQIAAGIEAAIMDTFTFAREPPSSNEISRMRVMKHEQGLRKIFRENEQRA